MKRVTVLSSAVVLAVVCASAAAAQSLGDIARKEEARRKAITTSGKVYTNDSLRGELPPAAPAAASGQTAPESEPADAPDEKDATPDTASVQPPSTAAEAATPPGGAAAPPADEASWRQRVATVRTALSRAQMFATALQSRIDALATDFANRDDPAQRTVVADDRDKAIAELARVQLEIDQHQKAITAIQSDARRVGVPAGWVR